VVERSPGRHERGDVGDVDPGAETVTLPANAERVVEVLRALGIDGEGEEIPQVDATRFDRRACRQRGMLSPSPFVPQEALEDGFDVVGAAQDPFDSAATTSESNDCEVADAGIPRALAVDHDGSSALEERLADEELPAPGKLGDEEGHV
jgi:hypothetical protein